MRAHRARVRGDVLRPEGAGRRGLRRASWCCCWRVATRCTGSRNRCTPASRSSPAATTTFPPAGRPRTRAAIAASRAALRPFWPASGMSARGYIHGGTDSPEVARLEKQARFCCPPQPGRVRRHAGWRVLDLAPASGAMPAAAGARSPASGSSGSTCAAPSSRGAPSSPAGPLRAARRRAACPSPTPPSTACFCYLASGARAGGPAAVAILREVRRVLRPGAIASSPRWRTPPSGWLRRTRMSPRADGGLERRAAEATSGLLLGRPAASAGAVRRRPASCGWTPGRWQLVATRGSRSSTRELLEELRGVLRGTGRSAGRGDDAADPGAAKGLRDSAGHAGTSFRYTPVVTRAFR